MFRLLKNSDKLFPVMIKWQNKQFWSFFFRNSHFYCQYKTEVQNLPLVELALSIVVLLCLSTQLLCSTTEWQQALMFECLNPQLESLLPHIPSL